MSIIILFIQWLGILFFTALIHESGHALACRYFGIPVLEMMVWSGSQRHRLQLGRLAIGWLPYGGYVATPFIYNDAIDFIITLCGPLANFLVSIPVLFTTGMLNTFFFYNLVVCIMALLPISKQKDGYRLLLIIKKWYNFRKHCR